MTATALGGLRVLDLSRVLAGPFCTQTLADLGATVWKIEPPWGDDTRSWGPPFAGGESAYYLAANRGKQSVAVDLKHPAGRQLVRRLAGLADVVVENFKAGDLHRYGLDYDQVAADNRGVVYVSITGFGQTGPRAAEPGYDLLLQAMCGIMAATGEPGSPPVKVGPALVDVMAGMMAGNAVLAALLERAGSGQGQHIDLSLFDVGVMAMGNTAQAYLLTGQVSPPAGSGHPQIVPYQAFQTADGWVVIAVGNDAQFRRLCAAVGAPHLLADERFASNDARVANRAELVAELARLLHGAATATWLARLEEHGVPAGPVNDIADAFADPQARSRGMQWRLPHPTLGEVSTVANALRWFSRTPARPTTAPPVLGEHTAHVLRSVLDVDHDQLARLEAAGAIRLSTAAAGAPS